MSRSKPTGWTYTLPLLNRPGHLVIMGTILTYGGIETAQVSSFLGPVKATRAIASLRESGWVRQDGKVLVFGGTAKQKEALTVVLGYGYTPLLEAAQRVRNVDESALERVRVFGSFAARLAGVKGRPPGDIDILIASKEQGQDRKELAMVIEDYNPSNQLELHTIVRSVKELDNPASLWGQQMVDKDWISLGDLPVGVEVNTNLDENKPADVHALFNGTHRARVMATLVASGPISVSELARASETHRTNVARFAAENPGWISTHKQAVTTWVEASMPVELRGALRTLLCPMLPQAATLMENGAHSVWAVGDYAEWLKNAHGQVPQVHLLAVNDHGWTSLRVAEMLDFDDTRVDVCDLVQWQDGTSRYVKAVRSRPVVQLA